MYNNILLIDVFAHLLICGFGLGTWLSINAVYVQLPLFVDYVPEGWNLASYMVIIIQLSCIVPLIYGIAKSRLIRIEVSVQTTYLFEIQYSIPVVQHLWTTLSDCYHATSIIDWIVTCCCSLANNVNNCRPSLQHLVIHIDIYHGCSKYNIGSTMYAIYGKISTTIFDNIFCWYGM